MKISAHCEGGLYVRHEGRREYSIAFSPDGPWMASYYHQRASAAKGAADLIGWSFQRLANGLAGRPADIQPGTIGMMLYTEKASS